MKITGTLSIEKKDDYILFQGKTSTRNAGNFNSLKDTSNKFQIIKSNPLGISQIYARVNTSLNINYVYNCSKWCPEIRGVLSQKYYIFFI